jgi:hypothetical protein
MDLPSAIFEMALRADKRPFFILKCTSLFVFLKRLHQKPVQNRETLCLSPNLMNVRRDLYKNVRI